MDFSYLPHLCSPKAKLITANVKHFGGVKGLVFEILEPLAKRVRT